MVLEHINLVLDELWWPKLTSTHLISCIYLLGCSFCLIQFVFLECILYIDRILNNIDWVKFLLWKDGHGFMCLKLMFIYLSLCHWIKCLLCISICQIVLGIIILIQNSTENAIGFGFGLFLFFSLFHFVCMMCVCVYFPGTVKAFDWILSVYIVLLCYVCWNGRKW